MREIKRIYPDALCVVCEHVPESKSPLAFYGRMCFALDPSAELSGLIVDRGRQVVLAYAAAANTAAKPLIIILVDEAQNMSFVAFALLKLFMTDLKRSMHIPVRVYFFGQLSLEKKIEALKKARRELWHRFLKRPQRLGCVDSEIALKRVLWVLDARARWPDPVRGWTWSQFFFPEAFAVGWRLAHEAKLLWRVLGGATGVEITYDRIRDVVKYYYAQFSQFDGSGWKGTPERWQEALDAVQ